MSNKFAMTMPFVSYSHKCWESNIIMADSLGVGKIFPDDESEKIAVAYNNKTYFTSFRISTNNKKSIVLKCKEKENIQIWRIISLAVLLK